LGIALVIGGLAYFIVALVVDGTVTAVIDLLVGPLVALGMYVVVRRWLPGKVADLPTPTTPDREALPRTLRRVAAVAAMELILFGGFSVLFETWSPLGGTSDAWSLFAGLVVAFGVILVLTSRWLHEWGTNHQSEILREPIWRWSREGRRRWGSGSGAIEPKSGYFAASTGPPT
jgi:hypothetical protein